jgi:nucleobase transporter 1/2
VVIAIATAWLFCLILTAAGAFDEDSKARTDARSAVLSDSPWFRIPYPGMQSSSTRNLLWLWSVDGTIIRACALTKIDYERVLAV